VIDCGVGRREAAAAAADTLSRTPDYIAESVDAFLTQHSKADYTSGDKAGDSVYLGFTFSFPVEQHALDKGKLLTWTKGFSAKNAVGDDVVQLLQRAFDRKHMHVKCVALVNDVSWFLWDPISSCDRTSL
jgi:hexokinase